MYVTVTPATLQLDEQNEEQDRQISYFWFKSYLVNAGSLHWSPAQETLYVRFDDGSVHRLNIYSYRHRTESNQELIKELWVDQIG